MRGPRPDGMYPVKGGPCYEDVFRRSTIVAWLREEADKHLSLSSIAKSGGEEEMLHACRAGAFSDAADALETGGSDAD